MPSTMPGIAIGIIAMQLDQRPQVHSAPRVFSSQ